MVAVELTVDQKGVQAVAKALAAEADGKKLRRQMSRNMRAALDPAVADARAGIQGMPSTTGGSPGLRQEIAKRIKAEARLTGRQTGARVKARQTPNLRGFRHAPKRTQSRKGWRRPVFGNRNAWVRQEGRRGWFDDAMTKRRREYRAAVKKAVDDMAKRIASKGA